MNKPTGRIRTALVGLGWAGSTIWLPKLREVSNRFHLVAVVDPSAEALDAIEDNCLKLRSADELDPSSIDLAIVVVPNHLHTSVGSSLLRRGITVFVEKPVCLTSAEAAELAAAEIEGGAVLLAGSAARYRSDVTALRRLISGLGPVRHVDVSWVRARGVPRANGWFTQRELAGGGALVDLGWHLLDTVVPLLGETPFAQMIASVSGDFVNADAHRAAWRDEMGPAGTGSDVEDTVRGFLITEDGVSLLLRASWASHEAKDITTIRVEATGGSATLSCTFGFSPNRLEGSSLAMTKDGVTAIVPVGEQIGCEYMRQLEDMAVTLLNPAWLRGQAIREAQNTIAVIERLYASARHRRKVAKLIEVAAPPAGAAGGTEPEPGMPASA